MKPHQTVVELTLGLKGDDVALYCNFRFPEFQNQQIINPPIVKFNPTISSRIEIIFEERTDSDVVEDHHEDFNGSITLGKWKASSTTPASRTLREWYNNREGQPVHLKYYIKVKIDALSETDDRETVTYISENAELDLNKVWEGYEEMAEQLS